MGKKILLADDSITIQKVIELTFSDEDFDVVTVGNGRLALERLAEVRPDIVLCDIIMPEKDGYEVCEQIKKTPAFAHVPVLLLTGAFEPFDQERAARAGYDGSLAKPFEPETLIAKVRDLLARAPQRTPPPPVVPFARPTPAPPPVAAAAPPAPAPPPPPARPAAVFADAPSFISDEPYESAQTASAQSTPLAPMSEEESATLLAPPPGVMEPEEAEPASTSTVMFKASDLPWNMPPPPPAPPPPAPAPPPPQPQAVAPPPVRAAEPAFVPDREAVFEPEQLDSAEVMEEPPVFEEVVEEDLELHSAQVGLDDTYSADTGSTVMFSGPVSVPGVEDASSASASTAAFGVVEEQTFSEADFEPQPLSEAEPEVEFETESDADVTTVPPTPSPLRDVVAPPPPAPGPVFYAPPASPASSQGSFAPPSPPAPPPVSFTPPAPPPPGPVSFAPPPAAPSVSFSPAPPPPPPAAPRFEEPSMSAPAPPTPAAPVPPVAARASEPVLEEWAPPAPPELEVGAADGDGGDSGVEALVSESFADVTPPLPEPQPAPHSEAASLSVPVEMVEKIAQRVVAQISEKAVREIAWEVIPELAEALIKQEIERLKAELQKT